MDPGYYILIAGGVAFIIAWLLNLRFENLLKRKDEEIKAILGQACLSLETIPENWAFKSQLPKKLLTMSVLVGQYRGHAAIVVRTADLGTEGVIEQTYVAVERSEAAPHLPAAFNPTFQGLQEGRWLLGTVDQKVLDVDGVRGILDWLT